MMKKKLFALMVLVCLMSGCTAKNSQLLPADESKKEIVTTSAPISKEKTDVPKADIQTEKDDVSGLYTGCNGTNSYSRLSLMLQKNGTYAVDMALYQEVQIQGVGAWKDDMLSISDEENGVSAYIFIIDDSAQVIIFSDEYERVKECAYSFTCRIQEKVSEGQENLSEKTLFEEIAAQIILAEIGDEELEQNLEDAFSQYDMNMASYDLYLYWDGILNTIWEIFKEKLSEEEMEMLTADQLEWIAYKETEIETTEKEYEGRSIYPLMVNSKANQLTKSRIYELAEYAMKQ